MNEHHPAAISRPANLIEITNGEHMPGILRTIDKPGPWRIIVVDIPGWRRSDIGARHLAAMLPDTSVIEIADGDALSAVNGLLKNTRHYTRYVANANVYLIARNGDWIQYWNSGLGHDTILNDICTIIYGKPFTLEDLRTSERRLAAQLAATRAKLATLESGDNSENDEDGDGEDDGDGSEDGGGDEDGDGDGGYERDGGDGGVSLGDVLDYTKGTIADQATRFAIDLTLTWADTLDANGQQARPLGPWRTEDGFLDDLDHYAPSVARTGLMATCTAILTGQENTRRSHVLRENSGAGAKPRLSAWGSPIMRSDVNGSPSFRLHWARDGTTTAFLELTPHDRGLTS